MIMNRTFHSALTLSALAGIVSCFLTWSVVEIDGYREYLGGMISSGRTALVFYCLAIFLLAIRFKKANISASIRRTVFVTGLLTLIISLYEWREVRVPHNSGGERNGQQVTSSAAAGLYICMAASVSLLVLTVVGKKNDQNPPAA